MRISKITIIIIILSALYVTNAQTQKFDVMTYTPPKGWTAGQNGQAKTFTTVDKSAGTFCMMFLYPSVTNHGTPSQDFSYVWKTLVQETFNAGGNPEKETTEADGFTMISGGELIDYEGTKALAMLATISGKGRVISLLTIMNDAKYATDVQNLLVGMDIDIKETRVETPSAQNGNSSGKPTSIIGEWSDSGAVLANYVNSSGQYVGDASSATTTIYKFQANGKYESFFASTTSFKTDTFLYRGNYKLAGDVITLTPTFYEHRRNTKVQPNNDPKNMKKLTFSYTFEKNTDRNIWGIRFQGDDDNFVGNSLLYRAGNSGNSTPQEAEPNDTPASVNTSNNSGSNFSNQGIEGVWVGFGARLLSDRAKWNWRVFFGNGKSLVGLPDRGFHNFNYSTDAKEYASSYAFSNGSGKITYDGGRFHDSIKGSQKHTLIIDGLEYRKCLPVTGSKLNATFSYYLPSDPVIDTLPVGQKPRIAFSPNGRFADEGLYFSILKDYSKDEQYNRSGVGTYELKEFSIILKYDDGRVKQESFTIPASKAASNTDMILMGRLLLNRTK